MKKILVIMAAGLGSRYGGVKQTARLGPGGEILMEYAIYDAVKAGFGKIVIIIKPEMLEDVKSLFGDKVAGACGVDICYAYQRNDIPYKGIEIPPQRSKPLGTVHALLSAADYIDAPFAVINADDYYGRHAMQAMSAQLDALKGPEDSAMVAYLLKNTVSRFGAVTRGICETRDNILKKVHETYKIVVCDDGSIRDESGEGTCALDPDSPVSMNMWGFHTGAIELADIFFREFLSGLSPDDNSSECLLPIMMDRLISQGKISTSVLNTDEQWFGLTYKEDAPGVQKALHSLHKAGFYPPTLW